MTTFAQKVRTMQQVNMANLVSSELSDADFLREVTDANRDQWEQGLNADGEKIGKYASDAYAYEKQKMNARAGFGNVDLMDTHDLEKFMYAKHEGDTIKIDSGDWKSEMLKSQYGDEIYGLTTESRRDVRDILRDKIIKSYVEKTGLKRVA